MNALKIHLGCGARYIPGFYHIDIQNYPHIDRVQNVDNLHFLNSNSVELIYASHVLEHYGRFAVNKVLCEWYRVLKPGGILRLSVPDFAVNAKLYVDDVFPDGVSNIIGAVNGGQKNAYDFHNVIFDERDLTDRLKLAGFSDVRKWDWRNTEHSDVDDYSQAYFPHMDKENGTLMSLNIEGIK
jgi:predicted SAM-dependent methyltransferase